MQRYIFMTFNELEISEPILKALTDKGYTNPTPIQEEAIPPAIDGDDILGCAQTGTGKTAAFAIPILQALLNKRYVATNVSSNEQHTDNDTTTSAYTTSANSEEGGSKKRKKHKLRALILTPTRELALQISECFAEYGKYTPFRHCVVFGGVNQRPQTDTLKRGVDILIATPGRLLDLMGQGYIHLNNIEHFVLDEADRMLDMGFIHDIKRIVPKLPENRQTLFFSATMPNEVVELTKSLLHNPVHIRIAPEKPVVETIDQYIYFVDKKGKRDLLIDVLKQKNDQSVLVFSRTKHGADKIAKSLLHAGIKTEAIHGNKTQNARQKALQNFKTGRSKVMIATDIASRGIDIEELPLVINYDMPDVPETYVHRIGRTGRAGHTGTALSFCAEDERRVLKQIQKMTGRKLAVVQ